MTSLVQQSLPKAPKCFSFVEYKQIAIQKQLAEDPSHIVIRYAMQADCWTRSQLQQILAENRQFECKPFEPVGPEQVEIAGTLRALVPLEDLQRLLETSTRHWQLEETNRVIERTVKRTIFLDRERVHAIDCKDNPKRVFRLRPQNESAEELQEGIRTLQRFLQKPKLTNRRREQYQQAIRNLKERIIQMEDTDTETEDLDRSDSDTEEEDTTRQQQIAQLVRRMKLTSDERLLQDLQERLQKIKRS